ncbi:MAG: MBL fold metallo-hydrolase [Spirochaetota bacterium]|jgi:glyoxylase-like metal-dependent hydrolase (beta-lactamase superfamily II)|nr:MBL fold metallo-hydrolase [Spirochaetota bacterium]
MEYIAVMNMIEFFGTVIKPRIVKGKYMFAPLGNQKINENIFALRDKDVNAFIYKKGGSQIAIDCGYKNCGNIQNALSQLGLAADATTDVFLTHLDLDHAGGADKRCTKVYPRAAVHIGKTEEGYITNILARKKILFIKLKTPIQLDGTYRTLADKEVIHCGDITVQALLTPGHTMGHLCYLVDGKYLFTGDTIILVQGVGYAFYPLWNIDTDQLAQSLRALKGLQNIIMVITAHSGYTTDASLAFENTDHSPDYTKKDFKVCDNAPYNPYI